MSERPPSDFKVEVITFRNGTMDADFPDEPRESAAYWKSVAESQRVRLDRAVEANRLNRQALKRAEDRLEQLKARSPEKK